MNAAHQKAEDARAGNIYNKGNVDTKAIAKEIDEISKSKHVTKEAKSDLNKSDVSYIATKTGNKIEKEQQDRIISNINKTRKESNITEPRVTGTIGFGSTHKGTGTAGTSTILAISSGNKNVDIAYTKWWDTHPQLLYTNDSRYSEISIAAFQNKLLDMSRRGIDLNKLSIEELYKLFEDEASFQSGATLAMSGIAVSIAKNSVMAVSGGAGTKFSPINSGPLSDDVAKTFNGGSYTQKVLTEDTVLYRVHGGEAGKVGSYMSRTPQNGGMQSQIDLALNPAWGNTASSVTKVTVPKGTIIYEGTAAPQVINGGAGSLLGGGNQVYIPRGALNPLWFGK